MRLGLNDGHRDLLRQILKGRSVEQIAHQIGVSPEVLLARISFVLQLLPCARSDDPFRLKGGPDMAWSVPTRRQRDALRAIGRAERGQSDDHDIADADACCRQGWAVLLPERQEYRLTEAGREILVQPTKGRGTTAH